MPLHTTTRKAVAIVGAIVLTAGAGAGTAAALSASSDDARIEGPIPGVATPGAPIEDVAPARDVPIRPAPHYAALERSVQKPTAEVAQIQKVLATRFPDTAGRQARGLKAADGSQAWVIAGSKHTCLGAENSEGTGYTCRTNDEALDGIALAERRSNGTQRSVLLVPDDIASVSAGGRVASAKNNLVVTEHRAGAEIQANPSDGGSSFRVGVE